jgi:hypothetical protein
MKLVLQTRKEFIDLTKTPSATGEYYYEYEQIEIESFEWGKNHNFFYIAKGSKCWSSLEENQEIVGLGI